MARTPSYLKKGDTVLIIATARARNKEQILPAIHALKTWGLIVETGKNLYKQYHQFAGTDKQRADDLQWALNHTTAKAIIIAGGGYGTLRIIDDVNFTAFKKYPKWIAGYSDTTVLHSRLMFLKTPCIHSTMAFQFSKHPEATESLRKLLFGEKISYKVPENRLNRAGQAEGQIVGGNLSLLYALSGSKDDVLTRNKILFIEDLDEQLYHIDRMLLQLKRSGKLKNLKALLVGGMTDMKDNAVPFGKTAEEIIYDAVKEYNYPVCFGFPAGHIEKNMALYFGKKASLLVSRSNVILEYL